jgi:hypothetical protein
LVSDKVGCAVDLVKENHNGAIFKSEAVDDLADKIKQLAQSKSTLNTYGKNSALMINDWDFLHIAEAIENKLLNETY